jgi:hypothetical protein
VRSGGRATVFACLCGSVHTASTDWRGRHAQHVREWEREHEGCAAELVARLEHLRLERRRYPYGHGCCAYVPTLVGSAAETVGSEAAA